MKRLLVLGDSLTLPRSNPEVCHYDKTWPVILRSKYNIHQVSIGGGTVGDLRRQVSYHIDFGPQIVIVQSGIVDCAPRAFSQFELELMTRVWLLNSVLKQLARRYSRHLRRIRGITYTKPLEFGKTAAHIRDSFPTTQFIWLGILPAIRDYEKKVPGITGRINEFNAILQQLLGSSFCSLDDIPQEGIMSDNIHLNDVGHSYVAKKVELKLLKH